MMNLPNSSTGVTVGPMKYSNSSVIAAQRGRITSETPAGVTTGPMSYSNSRVVAQRATQTQNVKEEMPRVCVAVPVLTETMSDYTCKYTQGVDEWEFVTTKLGRTLLDSLDRLRKAMQQDIGATDLQLARAEARYRSKDRTRGQPWSLDDYADPGFQLVYNRYKSVQRFVESWSAFESIDGWVRAGAEVRASMSDKLRIISYGGGPGFELIAAKYYIASLGYESELLTFDPVRWLGLGRSPVRQVSVGEWNWQADICMFCYSAEYCRDAVIRSLHALKDRSLRAVIILSRDASFVRSLDNSWFMALRIESLEPTGGQWIITNSSCSVVDTVVSRRVYPNNPYAK